MFLITKLDCICKAFWYLINEGLKLLKLADTVLILINKVQVILTLFHQEAGDNYIHFTIDCFETKHNKKWQYYDQFWPFFAYYMNIC